MQGSWRSSAQVRFLYLITVVLVKKSKKQLANGKIHLKFSELLEKSARHRIYHSALRSSLD